MPLQAAAEVWTPITCNDPPPEVTSIARKRGSPNMRETVCAATAAADKPEG